MPAIIHLQRRDTNGLSGTGIALIVCLGLVPAIILIWVVTWLMFFYAYDRTCCCTKRKKNKAETEWLGKERSSDTSAETLPDNRANPLPPQPFHDNQMTGSEYYGGRFTKADPYRPTQVDTRMSMQSHASASNVHLAHEPKPFI